MTQDRDVSATPWKFESSPPHHSRPGEKQHRAPRGLKRPESGSDLSGYFGDTDERWLACPDHPGFEVSDLGRVRSATTGKLVRQANALGYKRVILQSNGESRYARVHRLVAMAFIPNDRPEAVYVNHLDGDKQNNRLSNLEWCTPLENTRHSVAIGTFPFGEAHGASKLKVEQVHRIRALRAEGRTLRGIADEIGISDTAVFRIVSGKTWTRV